MQANAAGCPSPIEQSLCRLGTHDHLCLIYERHDDQLRAMVPFVQQGLESGERCVYVADGDTVDAVSGAMRRGGVEVDAAIRRGALTVARYKDIYLAPGAFDPDKVLDFAASAGIQAVGDGYRGLRIAGEMSWVLHGDPGADRILEYETKVNTRIHETPVTAICQYDRTRFTPEVIRDVIRTHPLVVIGDRVCRNFYFVPPGELRGPNLLDREVDRLLENILERERAEDALRESERRLSLVLEGSSDAFWDWDLPAGWVVHSARWSAWLGGAAVEQRGDLAGWRRVTHPEDWPAFDRALQEHLAGRSEQFQCEHRVRAAGVGWRWVLARGKVVARNADGTPQRVSGTVTDVTERRSLQARLETASRLASVGTLAAGVAHEINNPLTFVTNNLRFVADRLTAARDEPTAAARLRDLQQAIAEALDGAHRVRDIVQGLRGLASPPRDQAPIPVDVRAEIEAAAGIARGQVVPRAQLRVTVDAGLPRISASPHELGQVILNLLVNAAQAIPEGAPERNEVRVAARAEDGRVVVEVTDTGSGIPPAALPRIFDPFFTTKEVGAGTGLGLALCHQIVTSAGGTIDVQSEPGHGTRFRISLPALEGAPEPATAPLPPVAHQRRRVLLIDDEPFVGRAIARVLEREHDVEVLNAAEEAARRIAAGERWDAIFCDLLMPGMTGMDFAEELARTAPDAAGRLVFMTGGACTERARAFVARGVYACLEKPIEAAALLDAVERVTAGT